jgi:hypothetical protein
VAKSMLLTLEVCGCPTRCGHCWAQGGPAGIMDAQAATDLLARLPAACAEVDLQWSVGFLNEVLFHPSPLELLSAYKRHVTSVPYEQMFDLVTTTGVALAIREDWQAILSGLKELGTRKLWFAFHGRADDHDRVTNRPGSYEESCLALRRAAEAGFVCGCNVFLTKANLPYLRQMTEELRALGMNEIAFEVAAFSPTRRGREYECLRPELSDLAGVADWIAANAWPSGEQWTDLPSKTESSYHARAVAGEDWRFPYNPDNILIVCRNDFEAFGGVARLYGTHYGNLKSDGPLAVLRKALGQPPDNLESLYFGAAELPDTPTLASRYGDPAGTKVYTSPQCIRKRWLDRALETSRRY